MFKPIEVSHDLFSDDVNYLIPPMNDIPDDFKFRSHSKWNGLFNTWFFDGLPEGVEFIPNEGIDTDKARRHLNALMRTYSTKQEDKEKMCAYVMSLWFKDIVDFKGNTIVKKRTFGKSD